MNKKKYNLIVQSGRRQYPDKYELMVGELCAKWFDSDILFLNPDNKTSPDFEVMRTGERWEIKNIRGNGKFTIDDNLRKAEKQSNNVIISLLKPTKMSQAQAMAKIKHYLGYRNAKIKQVLLVTKTKKIIDPSKHI